MCLYVERLIDHAKLLTEDENGMADYYRGCQSFRRILSNYRGISCKNPLLLDAAMPFSSEPRVKLSKHATQKFVGGGGGSINKAHMSLLLMEQYAPSQERDAKATNVICSLQALQKNKRQKGRFTINDKDASYLDASMF